MNRFLLLLLLLSSTFQLAAQDYRPPVSKTLFYKISNQEAKNFIDNQLAPETIVEQRQAMPDSLQSSLLPPGQYLSATVESDGIQYIYVQSSRYEIDVFTHKKKFAVRVYNQTGDSLQNAKVLADEKAVRWSDKANAYLRKDWRIDHLQVSVNGDTTLYNIREDQRKGSFKTFMRKNLRNPAGYVISRPYVWVRNGVRYFKRGFRHRNWRMYTYPFQRSLRRIFNQPPYEGYITTNKPKYRPGDTLRFSAWLSKPKGKALNKPMRFRFQQGYARNNDTTIIVTPTEAGRYAASFLLNADSWQLDKPIKISASEKKRSRKARPTLQVDFSDYETSELQLNVKHKRQYTAKMPFLFDITAKDINGKAVAGGHLVATLTLKSVENTAHNRLHLKDTIWQQEWATDRTHFPVVLADSLFPTNTKLNLRLKVELHAAAGHKKQRVRDITLSRLHPEAPLLKLSKDSIYAFSTNHQPYPARIYRYALSGKLLSSDSIRLPYTEAFSGDVKAYKIRNALGHNILNISPHNLRPKLEVSWFRDSLLFSVKNPHKLNISYEITDFNHKHLESGKCYNSFVIPAPEKAAPPYLIHYDYWLGGKIHRANTPVSQLKKQLSISVEAPEKISPGSTQTIGIRVTDYKERPIANVPLTSGIYNARFKKKPHSQLSVQQREKRVRSRQGYSLGSMAYQKTKKLNAQLLSSMGYDSIPFYQLRMTSERYERYHPLKDPGPAGERQGQIAPFLVKDGKTVPIHLAYLDNNLVYFDRAFKQTPYSIVADTGHYKLRLISRFGTTEVANIHIKPKQLLVISTPVADDKRIRGKAHNFFTKQEQEDIFQRSFLLNYSRIKKHQQIKQVQGPVFSANSSPLLTVAGLFPWGARLQYRSHFVDSTELIFEPGFKYNIINSKDRLYGLSTNEINLLLTPSKAISKEYPKPARFLFSPIPSTEKKIIYTSQRAVKKYTGIDRGSIEFKGNSGSIRAIIICSDQDSLVYSPYLLKKIYLPAGKYQVSAIFKKNKISTIDIDVKTGYTEVLTPFNFMAGKTNIDHSSLLFWHDSKYDSVNTARLSQKANQTFTRGLSGTVYDQQDGEALPFATITVYRAGTKKTITGTTTDIDGHFILPTFPYRVDIEVTYTGYATMSHKGLAPGTQYIQVDMDSNDSSLHAVMVVAYRAPNNITFDNTTLSSREIRNLPTRNINAIVATASGLSSDGLSVRGSRSDETNHYVDGIRVQGNLIPESEINLFDGVAKTLEQAELPQIRSGFSDYAALRSDIRTDKDGYAYFHVDFPDDITAWNTFVLAQDRKMRKGMGQAQSYSFLDLQAQLYLPRFLVEGDRSHASGLVINRSETAKQIKLNFKDQNTGETSSKDTTVNEALALSYPIQVLGDNDSLYYEFSLVDQTENLATSSANNITDGERRSLPVYKKGSMMAAGDIKMITDSIQQISTTFAKPERGSISLAIYDNHLQQLLHDIERVIHYPYGCNEQNASRLIGLLALRKVKLAKGDAVAGIGRKINRMIKQLENNQHLDGSYGWWRAGRTTNWVNEHVFSALSMSKADGFDKAQKPLQKLLKFQKSKGMFMQWSDFLFLIREDTTAQSANQPTVVSHGYEDHELTSMMRHFLSMMTNEVANFPIPEALMLRNDLPLYVKLGIERARQLKGQQADIQAVLSWSKTTPKVGRYWGESNHRYRRSVMNDQLRNTLLAYEILEDAGRKAEQWEIIQFLTGQTISASGQLRPYLGNNTLASANIIKTILPLLLESDQALNNSTTTLWLGEQSIKINEFPFQLTISDPTTPIKIERQGSGPLLATAYQRWFEENPIASDAKNLKISSTIVDELGNPLNSISKQKDCYFEVEITNRTDAEYIMIEIPIPAGTAYANRNEPKGPFATHRAYRRDRVAIFCDRLPAGKHTYRVALQARFSGEYTINPARVEWQYLPSINANNALKQVEVR